MAITIKSNTRINSRTTVGRYGSAPTPPPPSSTFNFTFNQQYASANVTVSSIGGFTSTPSFTATSNVFTFNSTGSPTGSTTFSFTMTSGNITTTVTADLIQNGSTLEILFENIANGYTFVFTPITVSQNDTIEIRTYFAD
jgi:hypothetical protein